MTTAMLAPRIRTFTGMQFDFLNPTAKSIQFDDVAQGLAQECRFSRQTSLFYSVAEHSVLVSKILQRRGAAHSVLQLGLMHDAAEAYMGDMASPLKQLCPDFKRIEARVMDAVIERFRLPPRDHQFAWAMVHQADLDARAIEGVELMSGFDGEYGRVPIDLSPEFAIVPLSCESARNLFVLRYEELFPPRRTS
jgi:uncharacterized protein